MEALFENYRARAQKEIAQGCIRDISFSGSTYQVEIYDKDTESLYWPFFQFDDDGNLKDSFCSCDLGEGCFHIAAAFFGIHNARGIPFHALFERSFWNHLCRLFGDQIGFHARFLKKKGMQEISYDKELSFSLKTKGKKGEVLLQKWLEKEGKQTPENSILFSNIADEEIEWWKAGRPSLHLQYLLSFWADLAKWLVENESKGQFVLEHDAADLPTQLSLSFDELDLSFSFRKEELENLIPYLDTLEATFPLLSKKKGGIETISFDEERRQFIIQHSTNSGTDSKKRISLGEWYYVKGEGFFSKSSRTLLDLDVIEEDQIASCLDLFHEQLSDYLPIFSKPRALRYSHKIDRNGNWYIQSYLEKPRDLADPKAEKFGSWVYSSETKSFYQIDGSPFSSLKVKILREQVSQFVHMHRVWLSGFSRFTTHESSPPGQMGYHLSENDTLEFVFDLDAKEQRFFDFGDWIYIEKQGFFPTKLRDEDPLIHPGLKIPRRNIGRFIEHNVSDLELIPGFFLKENPVRKRGVKMTLEKDQMVATEPFYKGEPDLLFFDNVVYKKGSGFYLLPPDQCIYEPYLKKRIFSAKEIESFFAKEMKPSTVGHLELDPRLQFPKKKECYLQYVSRLTNGDIKFSPFLETELGSFPLAHLYPLFSKNERYFFSEIGVIDLHDPKFIWLRHLPPPEDDEISFEVSSILFLKSDLLAEFVLKKTNSPYDEVMETFIKELRDFSNLNTPTPKGLKSDLRKYQQTGLHWLWYLYQNHLSGILCDDMGLGKTHQAMALIACVREVLSKKEIKVLVVCPTSVIHHWESKLHTFLPGLKVSIFHGPNRSISPFEKNKGVLLTSYGILRSEIEKISALQFDLAIYDEMQVAKNAGSRIHQALAKVKASMYLGLTGTPIENNLKELKSLFDLVLPGYFPSAHQFRKEFTIPIEEQQNQEKRALLQKMVQPFLLRRKKEQVLQDLPEKMIDLSYCELSQEQRTLYQETIEKNRDGLLAQLLPDETSIDYMHVFNLLSRLKQICNHPALLAKDPQNYEEYQSGKWDLFVELLDEARASNQKVVVFTQYLHMLDIMGLHLKKRNWGYAEIRGSTADRKQQIERFQTDPDCCVFLGSLQAAGLGIDLTAANVVILYDRWWNAARENQAIDRVHRIGQKRGVQVYKLINIGTLEERIDKIINRKQHLMENVVSAEDRAVLKTFSKEELIKIFSL